MPKYCHFKSQNSSCFKQNYFGFFKCQNKRHLKQQEMVFKCQFKCYNPKFIYEIDPWLKNLNLDDTPLFSVLF